MLGPIVNAVTIILAAAIGIVFIKNVPERISEIVMKALALSTIFLGIQGALLTQMSMLLVASMVVGSILGELINIDSAMHRLGEFTEKKMGFKEGNFAKGFVVTSLLFCTGSMAIVGSLNSGLQGDHNMLFTKSILDATFALIFASQMGIGVAFSAVPVLLYEGGITIGASFMKDYLTPEIIREMSAVGSLLIAAIGFNFLDIKQIKIANMIPAIFIPWVYLGLFG